ncbi:hypothetical protein GGR51DRAFT_20252 [Nemania sp. FL0031]|nr:hypothetical protein GGR51DRAFT_20252 [Nemania sp. FL0031]
MSDSSRRVTFSPSPPRSVLKRSEPHPRDSGVGSSSSDHTGSSGSLDERFTARDYNIQSNNVDALREALADAIKDIDQWRSKYNKKQSDYSEARKAQRDTDKLYQTACRQIEKLEERMENQDVALEIANNKIQDLEAELSQSKDDYNDLQERYELRHSGGAYELSRQREDSAQVSRMKERINRDPTDSASSHTTRGSRSSEGTGPSRGSSQRNSASTGDDGRYIEKMPRMSNSSLAPPLASPRQRGTYTLTTAERRADAPPSSSRASNRERGEYYRHPL